jgi:hypothetical protein
MSGIRRRLAGAGALVAAGGPAVAAAEVPAVAALTIFASLIVDPASSSATSTISGYRTGAVLV